MGAEAIREPFAVINSDDFYGRDSFEVLARELMRPRDRKGDYCMVGFRIGNTMTENGGVNRGVCQTKEGLLTSVEECKDIRYGDNHEIFYTDAAGVNHSLDAGVPVSMNMWGFTPDYFKYSEEFFVKFLKENADNIKAEYFIPLLVNDLIQTGKASVTVLDTPSKWFGVTYAADRQSVVDKIHALIAAGEYPEKLF